jgi:hypothetical protein
MILNKYYFNLGQIFHDVKDVKNLIIVPKFISVVMISFHGTFLIRSLTIKNQKSDFEFLTIKILEMNIYFLGMLKENIVSFSAVLST